LLRKKSFGLLLLFLTQVSPHVVRDIRNVTGGQFFMENFFSIGAKLLVYGLNVVVDQYKCMEKIRSR